MQVYCPKLNIKVNQEEICSTCIFYRQKRDVDDQLYLVCDFDNWHPGDESSN
jgi:hypothetical protein